MSESIWAAILDRWSVWSAVQNSPATPALTEAQPRLINYPTDLFSPGCEDVEGNINAGTRGWHEEDELEDEEAVAAEEQMGEDLGEEVDDDEEELERIVEEDGEEELNEDG